MNRTEEKEQEAASLEMRHLEIDYPIGLVIRRRRSSGHNSNTYVIVGHFRNARGPGLVLSQRGTQRGAYIVYRDQKIDPREAVVGWWVK